jgi:hypothetical protein
MKKILSFCLFLFLGNFTQAQMLDYQNRITVTIEDGQRKIPITLFGAASSLSENFNNEYFYLPTNLKLGRKADGTPEFLFAKYTTEQREDAGGVQGALMHFLMEWSLDDNQIKQAEKKLNERIAKLSQQPNSPYKKIAPGSATIKGPAPLLSDKEDSFKIVSAVLGDEKMNRKTITTGKAPLFPGSKIAVASMLDKNGAQLLASTFEKGRSISDVSLSLRFKFQTLMPSVKGKIIVDWSKLDSLGTKDSVDFTRSKDRGMVTQSADAKLKLRPWWFLSKFEANIKRERKTLSDSIDYKQFKEIQRKMEETGVITIKIDGKTDDPLVQQVIETLTQRITESLTTKEMNEDEFSNADDPKALDQNSLITASDSTEKRFRYRFDFEKIQKKIQKKYEVYNLDVRVPIEQEYILTDNLASHYNQVKDNKKCVYSVNLNDPFFQHREINLVTDAEASEMITAGEINYATLAIRKKRDSGNPFNDSRTIDKSFLEKNGQRINLTYARGEDKNSDVYEYKVQYAMKGGRIIPENPQWKKGDWAGITIASPIKLQKLELEGNLEELQSQGISRVTMQVRYYKYRQEYEDNINLSVAGGKSLVEKNIYMDRNAQGYAYRIVFNDKTEGKLATEWDAKINDFYTYSTIPKELKERIPTFINRMRELGKVIFPVAPDGVVAETGKVLDKFKNLIEKVF